jgi:hypothetical protein
MYTFLASTLSSTSLRCIGAAGACLVILCMAIIESKLRKSWLLSVVLGLASIAGLVIVGYAIAQLQAVAL